MTWKEASVPGCFLFPRTSPRGKNRSIGNYETAIEGSLYLYCVHARTRKGQKNLWERLSEALGGSKENSSKSGVQSDRILISEVTQSRSISVPHATAATQAFTLLLRKLSTLPRIYPNNM